MYVWLIFFKVIFMLAVKARVEFHQLLNVACSDLCSLCERLEGRTSLEHIALSS